MEVSEKKRSPRRSRQKFFIARELQLTIAILTVLAILGGVFVDSISSAVAAHFAFEGKGLRVILIVVYTAVVALLAIVFSHRLVGPFRRLEYEMQFVRGREPGRRLSVRNRDDLHLKNFVVQVNYMIDGLEEMQTTFSKLCSAISTTLGRVSEEVSKPDFDREEVKRDLKTLQSLIHQYREKW